MTKQQTLDTDRRQPLAGGLAGALLVISLIERLSRVGAQSLADAPDGKNAGAIVQNIISLAHNLDMKVIAERMVTREQLAMLAHKGSDYAQGYLISEVASPQEMVDRLRAEQAPGEGDPFKATRENARR